MGRSQSCKDEGMHVLRTGRQRQRPRDGEGMEKAPTAGASWISGLVHLCIG